MKVIVILPAFNEAENLDTVIERIGLYLRKVNLPFHILVIDDGSTDSTALITQDAGERWPVALIRHPKNLGLGIAMQTAFRAVMGEEGIAVVMDADNSHDPSLILPMIEKVRKGTDVVIASRFVEGGTMIGVPWRRRLLSKVASEVCRRWLRYENVTDYTSGYRAYRIAALRTLKTAFGRQVVTERGFACMLEILLKLRAIGALVEEVPLELRYDLKRGASKMKIFRTLFQYAFIFGRNYSLEMEGASATDGATIWRESLPVRKVANS